MPGFAQSAQSRTLTSRSATVIPVTDSGDHCTVGIMTRCEHPDIDVVAVIVTPEQARQIAADLIAYANR